MLRLIKVTCDERSCTEESLTVKEEDRLYEQARDTIVQRDGGRTWAAGNVRLGEIILIVDSDTRVVRLPIIHSGILTLILMAARGLSSLRSS
jgi:hypothetical protein